MKEKFKLFKNCKILVQWIDQESKEIKTGELWNYIYIEEVISGNPNNNKSIAGNYIEWTVKSDDGCLYSLPETMLELQEKIIN